MGLSPLKLKLLRKLEEREGVDSVMEFIVRCAVGNTDGPTLKPLHLAPLVELFIRAEKKGGVRACVSVPPQSGKSTTILHAMVRYLQRNPGRQLAYIGYSHTFVMLKALEAKRIAQSCGLKLSRATVCDWTTKEGGGITFTSVGGKLLGLRKDLIVIDDPHSGLLEATSPRVTVAVLDWMMGTVMSRLSDPIGSVIVNAARWSQTDLIGRLIENDPKTWAYVNLRAILDEGLPTERAIWPEVKSLAWLKEQRRQLNSQNKLIWPANYEGSPIIVGGEVFGEASYYQGVSKMLSRHCRIAIGVDPACTSGRGDHASIFCLASEGEGADQVTDVLDYSTGQWDFKALTAEVDRLAKKWVGCPVYIETNGVGAGLPENLRSVNPKVTVHGVNSSAPKWVRAQPAAAAWNAGRLRLPVDREWTKDLVKRIRGFTGAPGGQDDDADALGLAYRAVDRPKLASVPAGGTVVRVKGLR